MKSALYQLSFLFSFLIIDISSVNACLWEIATTIDGQKKFDYIDTLKIREIFTTSKKPDYYWDKIVSIIDQIPEESKTIPLNTSLAIALAHRGLYPSNKDLERALQILLKIEEEHPGTYENAANLGTIYELSNNLYAAHNWIKRAMQINPDSHYGTEWLHLRIIEVKKEILESKQPVDLWLKKNSILKIDFGNGFKPIINSKLERPSEELIKALSYQLGERIQFDNYDPIIADLIFDLSNLIALTDSVDIARELLNISEQYGFQDTAILNKRHLYYWWLINKPNFIFTPLIILFFFFVYRLAKKERQVKKSRREKTK